VEECELCGRQTRDIYVVNVESVELRACASCAKGKKVIRTELESAKQSANSRNARPVHVREEDRPLVENYAKVIREARERMKLPIKVLAEMINEKEHLLLRIEEEKTLPTIALTKKLEKVLKVKLTEEPKEDKERFTTRQQQKPTIGDFIGE
jgi:putative transcription factor